MLKRLPIMVALLSLLWVAMALNPVSAQFGGCATRFCGPTAGTVGCEAYVGPGDVQAFTAWGSPLRAYSRTTCGLPAAYMCDSTGGVDNACADVFTSITTGKIIPKMIGSLMCFAESSGNCTAKIVYNIPLNTTCTTRGAGGTPGTCDAVQNTIANRYGAYNTGCNGGLVPCMFSPSIAGAGYTLNSSLTLAQPFTLWAVAFTVASSTTDTIIAVGNANIHFSSGSAGNVLNTCDSSATATNEYIRLAPTQAGDLLETCIGGVSTLWQNGLFILTTSSGSSSCVSGSPTIMASGGSPFDWWEFGIIAGAPSGPGGAPLHSNACTFYGYTCVYSGPGDAIAFKAYWGLQGYSAAALPQTLVNVCSAGDAACQDLGTVGPGIYQPVFPSILPSSGYVLLPTIGGSTGLACYVGITQLDHTTALPALWFSRRGFLQKAAL